MNKSASRLGITQTDYDKKVKEYKDKQYDINLQLEDHTKADESYYITASTVFNLAKDALELFESSKLEEKRAIINYLLSNYTITEEKPCITMRSSFNELLMLANQPIGLPMVDAFRTANWVGIKSDMQLSGFFELFLGVEP